jgi:ABC-type amino acid transport substrate-binding protein
MRKGLQRLFAVLALSIFSASIVAEEVLIFGDEDYRPVIYRNAEGQPAGILPEVLEAFAKASGTPIKLKLYPWKRAYVSAEKGLGGVIGVSKTSERMKVFDFSEPIYDDNISVVVLKGQVFAFDTLSDLQGRKIGVQSGASYGTDVDAAIAAGELTVEADQSHTSRLKKLLHGRIDAAFIGNGELGLKMLLESDEELARNADKFVMLAPPLNHDLLYLGFAKSMQMQPFLQAFNSHLAAVRARHSIEGQASMPPFAPADGTLP